METIQLKIVLAVLFVLVSVKESCQLWTKDDYDSLKRELIDEVAEHLLILARDGRDYRESEVDELKRRMLITSILKRPQSLVQVMKEHKMGRLLDEVHDSDEVQRAYKAVIERRRAPVMDSGIYHSRSEKRSKLPRKRCIRHTAQKPWMPTKEDTGCGRSENYNVGGWRASDDVDDNEYNVDNEIYERPTAYKDRHNYEHQNQYILPSTELKNEFARKQILTKDRSLYNENEAYKIIRPSPTWVADLVLITKRDKYLLRLMKEKPIRRPEDEMLEREKFKQSYHRANENRRGYNTVPALHNDIYRTSSEHQSTHEDTGKWPNLGEEGSVHGDFENDRGSTITRTMYEVTEWETDDTDEGGEPSTGMNEGNEDEVEMFYSSEDQQGYDGSEIYVRPSKYLAPQYQEYQPPSESQYQLLKPELIEELTTQLQGKEESRLSKRDDNSSYRQMPIKENTKQSESPGRTKEKDRVKRLVDEVHGLDEVQRAFKAATGEYGEKPKPAVEVAASDNNINMTSSEDKTESAEESTDGTDEEPQTLERSLRKHNKNRAQEQERDKVLIDAIKRFQSVKRALENVNVTRLEEMASGAVKARRDEEQEMRISI